MAEKIYGAREASYGVTERADGWIELRVYHKNKGVRRVLKEHIDNPSYFLRRRAAYQRSSIRAENHLAAVIRDYPSHFGQNRVQIILNPGAPQVGAVKPPPSPMTPPAQPPGPLRPPSGAPKAAPGSAGSTITPEEACKAIHEALLAKPLLTSPGQVSFADGLYFFYEDGETSEHGPDGRIVRVGNHPRSQGGLVNRLRMHYSGNKNSSVFRKFLGGALLRRANPSDPCLAPAPGKGHWEKQDEKTCPRCRPTEERISDLLRQRFAFRCVRVMDMDERNELEALLVTTLAACQVCRPSASWLGLYAYSDKVRSSGLWNSDYVGGATIDRATLSRFLALVQASP